MGTAGSIIIAVLLPTLCSSFSVPPVSGFHLGSPLLLRRGHFPELKRGNTALAAAEGPREFAATGWGTKAPWGRERVASSDAGDIETVRVRVEG